MCIRDSAVALIYNRGCQPGVFVWIVSAMTVAKVVEGCVYIRRRYYGILLPVGEFEHSALSPLSLRSLSRALSSNTTTLNHPIRLQGSQGIQIWKQRTDHTTIKGDNDHITPKIGKKGGSRVRLFETKTNKTRKNSCKYTPKTS